MVSCKPDSGKGSEAELMQDLVSLMFEGVSKTCRVIPPEQYRLKSSAGTPTVY